MFRTWCAIAAVAAVMERRFSVDVGLGPLFPNMYIILVAPPGIGKSELTSQVWNLLSELDTGTADGLHLGASSMTVAAVIDTLKDAERRYYTPLNPIEPLRYNSLAIVSNELGTLLPAYDPGMMNTLTDIYDGQPYAERRRTRDINFRIQHPQINILAATTPGHLTNSLPEGAWDQGFLSRTMLIFNGERKIRPLFARPKSAEKLRKDLQNDLAHIFSKSGTFEWSDEAAAAVQAWHMAGGPPAPDHPRLSNYNTRRTAHLLKLCMVASIACSDSLVIEVEHFNQALDWLLEAEIFMPDIFKAMVINADMKAMDECWHFAYLVYVKEGRPVAEHRLVSFLQERVPVQNVMRMLHVMEHSRILEKVIAEDAGNAYKPKARKH